MHHTRFLLHNSDAEFPQFGRNMNHNDHLSIIYDEMITDTNMNHVGNIIQQHTVIHRRLIAAPPSLLCDVELVCIMLAHCALGAHCVLPTGATTGSVCQGIESYCDGRVERQGQGQGKMKVRHFTKAKFYYFAKVRSLYHRHSDFTSGLVT